MSTVNTTADLDRVVAPLENGRSSTAAPAPPQIDRDTFYATKGIAMGALLGAALWAVILTVAWLIFG